jgi:spermidine/putrescine-binding protein
MDSLKQALRDGRLSRRQLTRLLAGAGLALVTLPLVGRASRAEEEILYFSWEGYDDPALHPAFTAKHGDAMKSATFASEEEGLLKVRAGFEATLAHPSTYSVGRWLEAGVLQPIDTGRLKNYPDLFPSLTSLKGVVAEGKTWMIPCDWGNSSIIYRTDQVQDGESWKLLFDERYAGRLSMYSDPEPCVVVAALALGYDNPFTLSDEQLGEVKKLLAKQKTLMRFYWDSQTSMEQAMASGEVVAAYGWNSSYAALKAAGHPVAYARPKEGILTWVSGLSLLNPAYGSIDLAYDFIDAMTDPEVGKYFIEAWGYGHSNRKAFEIAEPAAIEAIGLGHPEELFTQGVYYEPVDQQTATRYVQAFTEATL